MPRAYVGGIAGPQGTPQSTSKRWPLPGRTAVPPLREGGTGQRPQNREAVASDVRRGWARLGRTTGQGALRLGSIPGPNATNGLATGVWCCVRARRGAATAERFAVSAAGGTMEGVGVASRSVPPHLQASRLPLLMRTAVPRRGCSSSNADHRGRSGRRSPDAVVFEPGDAAADLRTDVGAGVAPADPSPTPRISLSSSRETRNIYGLCRNGRLSLDPPFRWGVVRTEINPEQADGPCQRRRACARRSPAWCRVCGRDEGRVR